MPEGDTLRRLADRITGVFEGERVERNEWRDPRLAGRDLVGSRLVDADAYGKHLFVRFDDGRTLHAHLLMHGSFAVGRASREPEWKRRAELWFAGGRLTAESVPVLELIPAADEQLVTARLGPDLCSPAGPPDPGDIAARLVVDPERPLVGALLDQRLVAGFGNIYVNDTPFVMGVSPFQPVGSIDGLADLVAVGAALIRTNARLGPQNTTGRRLHTDARWVHGVGRRPCPVCGVRLEYRTGRDTPWERSITWCPECQRLADRATTDLDRARRLLALHPAMREPSV
jgi:endonuclease-8